MRSTGLGLTYSYRIGERTSVGGTVRWFVDEIPDRSRGYETGSTTAKGYTFDMGVIHRPNAWLTIGAALRNYGPSVRYERASQSSSLPLDFTLGADMRAIRTRRHTVTIVGELYKPLVQDYRRPWYLAPIRGWYDESFHEERRQTDVHLGAEYGWRNRLFVRGGWFRDWDGNRKWFTYGAGLRWPIWKIAVSADVSVIHATRRDDLEDGRWAFSLGLAL